MKTMKKITALVISIVMVFSVTTVSASAISESGFTATVENYFARLLGIVVEGLATMLNCGLKENDSFVQEADYSYDNFFEGTEKFITSAQEGASWSLGQAQLSLVPENLEDYELYLGGFMSEQNFFNNDLREVLDDMMVRVIALNDGSGRGTAVFATIDAIGVSNGDIRHIREMLQPFAEKMNINSINIFSTHSHSCIDTQGLWTNIFEKWPTNIIYSLTGLGQGQSGTDEKYMEFFCDKVKTAIENAVGNMNEGLMLYAEKDIGEKYFSNKNRPSASSLDTKLRRFTFAPYNKSVRPTIILNMAAHPDVVGLATADDDTKGHGLSGDYVYYIGETLDKAGYDFMFFNGAICGIYIGRIEVNTEKRLDIAAAYGREIGKMTLGMTMTESEIKQNDLLMSLDFTAEQTEDTEYTPWYEGWEPVEQRELESILNIRLKKVELEITNPIIKAAGKLGVVNYVIKVTDKGKYFVTTEIGYLQMGDVKILMVPGEFCSDLTFGGSSLTADGSINKKDFEGKTLTEIFGEDIAVFGLSNDAIGYIVPDNDYCLCLGFGHYQEMISLGRNTASTLMTAFEELAAEIA